MASIVLGAEADNNVCSAGIAPGVTLSVCYALDSDDSVKPTRLLEYKLDEMDISNNWGRVACRSARRRLEGVQQRRQLQVCPFTFIVGSNPNPCVGSCLPTDFGPGATTSPTQTCLNAIADHSAEYYDELGSVNVIVAPYKELDIAECWFSISLELTGLEEAPLPPYPGRASSRSTLSVTLQQCPCSL